MSTNIPSYYPKQVVPLKESKTFKTACIIAGALGAITLYGSLSLLIKAPLPFHLTTGYKQALVIASGSLTFVTISYIVGRILLNCRSQKEVQIDATPQDAEEKIETEVSETAQTYIEKFPKWVSEKLKDAPLIKAPSDELVELKKLDIKAPISIVEVENRFLICFKVQVVHNDDLPSEPPPPPTVTNDEEFSFLNGLETFSYTHLPSTEKPFVAYIFLYEENRAGNQKNWAIKMVGNEMQHRNERFNPTNIVSEDYKSDTIFKEHSEGPLDRFLLGLLKNNDPHYFPEYQSNLFGDDKIGSWKVSLDQPLAEQFDEDF